MFRVGKQMTGCLVIGCSQRFVRFLSPGLQQVGTGLCQDAPEEGAPVSCIAERSPV